MEFKVVNPIALSGDKLKGKFSLMIGPMRVDEFMYFELPDGKSFVGMPSQEFIDKESMEKKYRAFVYIEDNARYQAFQEWAKAQVKDLFAPKAPAPAVMDDNDDLDIPF